MKIFFYFTLFLLSSWTTTFAQKASIIDDLNLEKGNQGSVVVYQDEALVGLLGSKSTAINQFTSGGTESSENGNSIRARGYKIQVFSGNDQKRSKNESEYRKRQITGNFPDMEVSIDFNSPVWRVRAGNYRTFEEASEALKELKNAFPAFSREMLIVQDVIKITIE